MTKREVIEMLTAKAECIRREASGTDIDCNLRNCDECDLCYKQGTTGDQMEALRVAISALQAQDLQPICNELAKDTISRQAAIDAANDWLLDCFKVHKQDRSCGLIRRLEDLPSAQPTQTDTSNTLKALDCVERQAAIGALMDEFKRTPTMAIRAKHTIEQLPSAEPDVTRCGKCTHKDKKIDYCHYLGITICECDYCSHAVRRTNGVDC